MSKRVNVALDLVNNRQGNPDIRRKVTVCGFVRTTAKKLAGKIKDCGHLAIKEDNHEIYIQNDEKLAGKVKSLMELERRNHEVYSSVRHESDAMSFNPFM